MEDREPSMEDLEPLRVDGESVRVDGEPLRVDGASGSMLFELPPENMHFLFFITWMMKSQKDVLIPEEEFLLIVLLRHWVAYVMW